MCAKKLKANEADERVRIALEHCVPKGWQLFDEDDPEGEYYKRSQAALKELNATFRELIPAILSCGGPENGYEYARGKMDKIMDRHSNCGAADTEGRETLNGAVQRLFAEAKKIDIPGIREGRVDPKPKKKYVVCVPLNGTVGVPIYATSPEEAQKAILEKFTWDPPHFDHWEFKRLFKIEDMKATDLKVEEV